MSHDIAAPPNDNLSMQNALIEVVGRKDIDPDRLEKFIDLQIKMEDRQAKKTFNQALSKFQGDCPIIKKTKKINFKAKSGQTTKYNYSPLDEIVFIAKPFLKSCGLSFTFNVKVNNNQQDAELVTTVAHLDGHEKIFSYFFPILHDDARMNLSQRRKSAITYAKRAALENALGIVTAEEDDDARRTLDEPESLISPEGVSEIKNILAEIEKPEEDYLVHCKRVFRVSIEFFEELTIGEAETALKQLRMIRKNLDATRRKEAEKKEAETNIEF